MPTRNGTHKNGTTRNGHAKRNGASGRGRPAAQRYDWVGLGDTELLDLRFCDLELGRVEDAPVVARVERLYDELAEHDIVLRPHVWFSSEWFSPDGVPGIALPFYLGHERLTRLEQKMFIEVEGAGERQCMRILRHEAGHAVCTAYRLHYRKRWRELFGRFTEPYPDFYQPKPDSKDFVVHLERWYAQAHPAEDFAETFAVWLHPSSRWRQRYKGWRAMRKLEYVDELMHDIAGQTPPVRSRQRIEPLNQLKTTLREHYRKKRETYADDWPDFYDRDLRRLFSDQPEHARRESAAVFLRRIRPEVREAVAKWTGEYQYTIDQVLRDMIDRCKELKLRVRNGEQQTQHDTTLMVAVQTMAYLCGGRHRIAL